MAEKELAILVKAKGAAAAARDVGKVDASVSKLGTTATKSLGKFGKTAGAGLDTLKGRVNGLAGAIGPLVGVGGLLGLTGLLASSVNEAADFGSNVAKVAAVTNLATPAASAMVDTLDKWGVSSDRLLPILGKLEKNVGTLAAAGTKGKDTTEEQRKASDALTLAQVKLHEVESKRGTKASTLLAAHQKVADAQRKLTSLQGQNNKGVSGAALFQKQYGVSLLDSSGKIADANVLLQRSADYFNSNATATQKATFMSELWGKGWQDLVPILSKGSAFIRAQEADAIKLTDTQVDNITKFRAAQRDFADAFGDVQVKIGAEIMPLLTTGLSAASAWFDSHGDEVSGFFRDAAKFAGDAAKSAGEVFGQIKSGWESIPGPLREFLVKGIVADRTIKFLFGVSPISLATGALSKGIGGIISGVLGGFAQRGSSPANPVFVSGGGPGGLPAPGGGGGGGGLGALSKVFLVGEAIGLAVLVNEVRNNIADQSTQHATDVQSTANDWLSKQPSRADLETGLAGVEQGIRDIKANPLLVLVQGEALTKLEQMQADIKAALVARGDKVLTGPTGGSTTTGALQDTSEKAQQRRNSVFTSNPTRNELRTKIAIDKHNLDHATGKNAVDIGKHLRSLQNRLDNRIATANAQANAVAAAAKRDIVAAIDRSKAALPAPTVIVPVNVSFSARNAASAIAVTTIRSGNFGAADHPGGGGA